MNFSFSELIVIILVALLVIRPEQLPEAAFTLGRFTQMIRRFFTNVKNEMNSFIEPIEKSNEPKS